MFIKTTLSVSILLLSGSNAMSQVSGDSLRLELDKQKRKAGEMEIINTRMRNIAGSSTKIRVLQTCSTNPSLCGLIVTASVTKAVIISGTYAGDTILIAAGCERTYYEVGKVYLLKSDDTACSNVHLCSGGIYNPDWNYNLSQHKYLFFFGHLIRGTD